MSAIKLKLKPRTAPAQDSAALPPWPILVVDDDEQVHQMTRVLLRDYVFDGRGFAVTSARSAAEATSILDGAPDFPVVLLDVVMETPDAGLQLVRRIREDMGNRTIRIILRTGQPGEAPERDVVLAYDVNDYKNKTELTAQKLFTALVGAIRAWTDIVTISRLNQEMATFNASLEHKVAERTAELKGSRDALARSMERTEVALARETEARHQLRQFLSMVSHEFRTPLAIIDSSAQMLGLRAERLEPAMMPRLQTIRSAVTRMVDLIETCLADEQLDSGRMVIHEQAVDIAATVRKLIGHHAASGRRLEFDLADGLPAAWGDPGLLALAVGNLIGNALKYSPDHTAVTISAKAEDDCIVITVDDRGIGIPSDDLPRVFDRFHRAANVHGIGGSGIGLHMVRQIADLHGAVIDVAGRDGGGTSFTLRLRPAMPERGRVR